MSHVKFACGCGLITMSPHSIATTPDLDSLEELVPRWSEAFILSLIWCIVVSSQEHINGVTQGSRNDESSGTWRLRKLLHHMLLSAALVKGTWGSIVAWFVAGVSLWFSGKAHSCPYTGHCLTGPLWQAGELFAIWFLFSSTKSIIIINHSTAILPFSW